MSEQTMNEKVSIHRSTLCYLLEQYLDNGLPTYGFEPHLEAWEESTRAMLGVHIPDEEAYGLIREAVKEVVEERARRSRKRNRKCLEKAIQFLQKRLADGRVAKVFLFHDAEWEGITKATIYAAAKELRVIHTTQDMVRYWSLPGVEVK